MRSESEFRTISSVGGLLCMKGICERIFSSLKSLIDGLNNEYKSQFAFVNTKWGLLLPSEAF